MIAKVLGTDDLYSYLGKYDIELDVRFNDILGKYAKVPFRKYINADNQHLCSDDALEFLSGLLVYDHLKRLTPREAMALKYFDPVRK